MRIRSSICLLLAAILCTTFVKPRQAAAAYLINSWENSLEGWGTFQGDYQSGGFVTSPGVTNGTYSWEVTSPTNTAPNYAGLMGGTASTQLTSLLALPGQTISIDVFTAPGAFSYMQWDLTINNSDTGYQSVDGYSYSQSPTIGSESTLTFAIPPALQAILATSSNPTSINYQIGGGQSTGPATFYVDNLRASVVPVPEPTSLALLGLGSLGLIGMAIRRKLS